VPEAVALANKIYASPTGGAGCCLHVLLDDANYDSAEWCLANAREQGHVDCIQLAEMLTKMSPSQIRRVAARAQSG
jgi:hypothetical protein